LAQEPLEEETTDFLGRDRYVRHRGGYPHRGYRNGYDPGRVRTAEGDIPLQIPQVLQTPVPYQSRLLSFLRDVLDRLVAEMYARGLSMRDIEDAFRDITGASLVSASGVSVGHGAPLGGIPDIHSARPVGPCRRVPLLGRDL
jgi:transposase-like protein